MATMQYQGKLAILVWVAACGDGGGSPTTSLTITSTSVPMTGGPSSMSMGEETDGTAAPTSTPTNDTTIASTATSSDATEPVEGGPVFLSFGSNVMKITDGEMMTFTALVTDPDGIDDIVGGSLLSEDEAIDFGPFVAAGQEGTYSIALSWDQIHQADPIEFETGAVARTFAARFFDQKGNKATKTAALTLFCVGGASCGGECKDLAADGENCGSCGYLCDAGVDGCDGGACKPSWSPCATKDDGFMNCDQACAAIQETCVENACGPTSSKTTIYYGDPQSCEDGLWIGFESKPCSQAHVWGGVFASVRCCCTDTH